MRIRSLHVLIIASAMIVGIGTTTRVNANGSSADERARNVQRDESIARNQQLGLPALNGSVLNAQAALGRRLFFDKRLSADGQISCAACHRPDHALSDGKRTAQVGRSAAGTRNTPSLFNVAFNASQFWDGRKTSLEDQALAPFTNPLEHGLVDVDALMRIVNADATYRNDFERAYRVTRIKPEHVARALSDFERTLLSGNSAFDRYRYGDDARALDPGAQRGLALFTGRARCSQCHSVGERSALFTDQRFHRLNIGTSPLGRDLPKLAQRTRALSGAGAKDLAVATDADIAALGRFVATGKPADIGAFRTPSLRNVALTAPYMHDGSIATLEDAVEHEVVYRSGSDDGTRIALTLQERDDLVAFLRSLTSQALLARNDPRRFGPPPPRPHPALPPRR